MTGVWIVLLYYGSYLLIGQFILIPTSHFHYFKLFPLKWFPFNEYTVTISSCIFILPMITCSLASYQDSLLKQKMCQINYKFKIFITNCWCLRIILFFHTLNVKKNYNTADYTIIIQIQWQQFTFIRLLHIIINTTLELLKVFHWLDKHSKVG